ncbi:YceI family protein [Aggregatilineales bacterium SYSU G02658]
MKRQVAMPVVIVVALVAFVAGAGAGVAGWLWLWGGNDTPSQAVENVAPQLSLSGSGSGSGLSLGSSTPTPAPTETSMLPIFAKIPAALDQMQPEPEVTAQPTPEPMAIDITRGLYRINPELSRVLFILQEDLRGQRIDVIGVTNQVAGDMIVDFASPPDSVVGQIVVNARTLETDNTFRNQAIRSEILRSAQDTYEFITFTPTGLAGLEDAEVLTNTPITAQITGDLKIVDTTRSVTFDAELVVLDDLTLTGTASVVVRWADFGLRIPQVPGVSNITDDVTLTIEFTADLIDFEGNRAIGYNRGLFRIDPAQSEARFILQEDLRGQRIDVIGVTNQVGGDLIVDVNNPAASQVGQIVVNARTLETDNTFRNQAIRSEILRSAQDTYEFITFTPTTLGGLDAVNVAIGEPVTFTITGDLRIVETTRRVTFEATATLTDPQTLTGSASVVVRWADFGLRIPQVPGVSNITDDVALEIDFVAALIDSE